MRMMMNKAEAISSTTNPKFKVWTSLLHSKGIKEHGKYLIFGKTVVEDILQNESIAIDAILLPEAYKGLESSDHKTFLLSNDLFKELDIFGTKFPILVTKCPNTPTFDFSQIEGLSLFVPVGDPSNLGAILRSCNAFGVKRVILLKEAANPFHPKSVRAASGSLSHLTFFNGPSIHDLQPYAANIYALDTRGEDIRKFKTPKSLWLLIGEEGPGLPDFDFQLLSIPIAENCESLNAAVAAGIALYQLSVRL